jgi:hypothetical protein
MTTHSFGNAVTDDEIMRSARWRFRICNYLFNLSAVWMAVGLVGFAMVGISHEKEIATALPFTLELIGMGIFSAAFALTLAIYRCPVCDKYLSRFRPRKEYCPSCGAKVR